MIAREGVPFILIGFVATLIAVWMATRYDSRVSFVAALLLGLLTLFTTYFFRDPNRTHVLKAETLVSPADGKVIGIDHAAHPFIGGECVKISIFLSVFDVHINRVPASGSIDYVKYNPGKFFAAFQDKASELNEQTEIGMTSTLGRKVVFKQIAGLIARRIVCRLNAGDAVTAGDRFGLIRFGSRTELFVPADSEINIRVGDHLAGGKTIIGHLKSAVASDSASVETTRERL